jgi:TatA/E family protein of Tat protein translocase
VDIGPGELAIVAVIARLFFGPSQLPRLSRSLGEARRELRVASRGDDTAGGSQR